VFSVHKQPWDIQTKNELQLVRVSVDREVFHGLPKSKKKEENSLVTNVHSQSSEVNMHVCVVAVPELLVSLTT